jgi:hypothetical protein
MNGAAWIMFDPVAGRFMCQHCGRSEPLRVAALWKVLRDGAAFYDTHTVCPSQSEVLELRMGEAES